MPAPSTVSGIPRDLAWFARPCSRFAAEYDRSIGLPFFRGITRAFEALVRRFDVRFREAADLGCGTGLFARYLNRRWGVPVLAVDRSTSMLDRAAHRCRGTDVRLLCQDIRGLDLPHAVDLVTANFDTLNHLLTPADLQRTLRRIALSLRPGGHFIFDFVTDRQPHRTRRPCLSGRRRRVAQTVLYDPAQRRLSIAVTIASAHRRPLAEVHHERACSLREMADALLDAGFIIRGVHDAHTLGRAEPHSSRLIVVAQGR